MSTQISQKGAIRLLGALFEDDDRRIRLLVKALARLGCSCVTRTAEVELEAHTCFCRYKMAMQDMELS